MIYNHLDFHPPSETTTTKFSQQMWLHFFWVGHCILQHRHTVDQCIQQTTRFYR